MTSQVFYRKWRPQTLEEVVGQEHVTRTLENALQMGRVAHAYLFCGPRGTGKTSTGRILAKAVNCLEGGTGEPCNACSMCQAITEGRALDVIEVDAASNRGIDEIRDLREKVHFAPNMARYKVYIIDEVHMLTEPASNALLKTLEEPPPYVIFILATTEPHKVTPTILSRCQRFDFHRLNQASVTAKLERICEKEGITYESEALRLIAKSATGSLRDAENILEQLFAYYGADIGLSQVQALLGVTGDKRSQELARCILGGDIARGLQTINGVVADGLDLRQFNRELVDYLRMILLVKSGAGEAADLTKEALEEVKGLAASTSLDQILKAVKLFGEIDLRLDSYSSLPLELALVESALPEGEGALKAPSPERVEPKIETQPIESRTPEEPTYPTEVEHIRRNWKMAVEALRGTGSKGNLDAFLRSACEPVGLEEDTIVLGFYHSFHKEKIEDPKYRHLVEEKLSEVFGASYRIRCILIEKEKRSLSQGHLVRAAMEMGARIIEPEEQ